MHDDSTTIIFMHSLISPHLSWTPPVSVYNFIISLELTQPIRDSSRIKSLFDAGTRVHGPFDAGKSRFISINAVYQLLNSF